MLLRRFHLVSLIALIGTGTALFADAQKPPHWSFVPPQRSRFPKVGTEAWCQSPVDRFVLARLEKEGMKPAPDADKITLLRRLYLDLIGLPPTPAEVDAFVADPAPDAYEKQVERLLANPHYGERWGRHWLDAARYADSDGFEKDMSRQVWFYRDYVINAFNADLPYDRFLTEQFAGDELPNATQDQVVATGFLRNAMLNEEGGVDPEQFRMDAMFDRMDAIGKSVLGLTIQCAQCHDHKYDPLKQEEYYKLFAFLNNDYEAQRTVYTPQQQMKVAEVVRKIRETEAELRHKTRDWEERLAKWEAEVAKEPVEWTVLPLESAGDGSQRYIPQKDGSLLAQGYKPTKFTAPFSTKTKLTGMTAFRLELLPDPNLPAGGPGRSFRGTCALTEFKVEVAPADQPEKKSTIKIIEATSDYDQPQRDLEANFYDKSTDHRITGPVKFAIDGDKNTAWGIDAGPGRRNVARKAVFKLEKPIEIEAGKEVIVTFSLQQSHGGWNSDDHMNNNLGRFRISGATAKEAVKADPLPKRVREIFAIAKEKRSPQQIDELFTYWRTTVPEFASSNSAIDSLWNEWPEGTTQLALIPREEPRDTRVLQRGDWLKPLTAVAPAVPAFLNPLPAGTPPTRLSFAKWLTDRNAPTTARVFVNRMWQAYFGTGIVGTSEDLGLQGETPSHPELLDWLAVEFMEPSERIGAVEAATPSSPWSIKHIHRLIVNSATYRQHSAVTPEQLAKDPYNRLLGHGSRVRVEGEIVHDIALAASGLLNNSIGGRSVMPPAPAYLFQPPASYAPFPWVDETGPEKYRRAIYTFRRRSTPYPALQTFDVPNADASCVRRLRSNTPLQALVTLNEPIFVECARALAKKALTEGGKSDRERVTFAFRQVLSRAPAEAETAELVKLLEKQTKRYAEGWVNPIEMATGKTQPPAPGEVPNGVTPTQWAAYTAVTRVILNLDEAITRE